MYITKLIVFAAALTGIFSDECQELVTDYGKVCVCNSTYCDTVPEISVKSGSYQVYSTSKEHLGFGSVTEAIQLKPHLANAVQIVVNRNVTLQKIIGFGGSFTDSAGIVINSLPVEAQEKLMQSYFGDDGLEYSFCRVPIGGTDFSTRGYSYDDHEGDADLEKFQLQNEDYNFKIPYIQRAKQLRNGKAFNLIASSWSSPIWMKTNNDWMGIGVLKEEYYQSWADYYVRFFDEYAENGVDFWGVTTQNEPADGFFPNFLLKINSLGFLPSQMNKWVGENFGPTIRNSSYSHLKIILHDDSRALLPLLPQQLENDVTVSYADGVAVHWYLDKFIPADWLGKYTKSSKKDLFLISTEASSGFLQFSGIEKAVELGSWKRGEDYIKDIFVHLQYGAGGWVDWNMVLDTTGGPCYVGNYVDAPIIANNATGEFYKQPMFYAMGHFAKFVPADCVALETAVSSDAVTAMGFLRPDGLVALIIFNGQDAVENVEVGTEHGTLQLEIAARSINTVLF